MNVEVVVETNFDKQLLEMVLKAIPQLDRFAFRYYVANSPQRLPIVARTVILGEPLPLIILMDADTNDMQLAETRKQNLESYLNWVKPVQPYRTLVAIPEFDVVLFTDPSVIESKFKQKKELTSVERDLSQFAPKALLDSLTKEHFLPKREALLDALTQEDVSKIAKHQLFKELTSFLNSAVPKEKLKTKLSH
jgi:hypothetical protein